MLALLNEFVYEYTYVIQEKTALNQIETDQKECLPNFSFVQPRPVVNIAKQFRISQECMLYPLSYFFSTKSLTQNWKACFFVDAVHLLYSPE